MLEQSHITSSTLLPLAGFAVELEQLGAPGGWSVRLYNEQVTQGFTASGPSPQPVLLSTEFQRFMKLVNVLELTGNITRSIDLEKSRADSRESGEGGRWNWL